jgi:hypothetical protein
MLVERRQRPPNFNQIRRPIDRIVELLELGADFM